MRQGMNLDPARHDELRACHRAAARRAPKPSNPPFCRTMVSRSHIMSSFNHVQDINDVALKPRLLHTLLNNKLPTETTPFRNPSDLTDVVSALNTHQLLFEDFPATSGNLKSAVDAWVQRALLLARSNSPDKSWAGVCLLGVTCTGCSSERFLSSFSDWFNVLVPHIQSGVSEIVRAASCAAASDLLTRLGGFPNIKKDGISCVGKVVQPILKTFNGDATEEMLEVAAELLCMVLTYFPSALQRYYDNAEAAIVSKIMSGKCSSSLLKKLACCLASLPKSRGDEESWSLMMQKILLSLFTFLDSALEGLEEESTRLKAVKLLVPPGNSRPPPLGGLVIGREAIDSGERSQQFVISVISCLMQSCCTMLTSSYQVQVVVPVRPLLAMIGRVLMANGSLSEALQPYITAMLQELVCLYLPVLHQNVLEVLAALQKGLHSHTLSHAAEIVWLLTKYFEKCWLPELRTKAYTIIKSLLISMGAGMAIYISQVVIDNGFIDLKVENFGGDKGLSSEVSVEQSPWHQRKRRKHGYASGPSVEHQASSCSEVKEPQELPASVSLKIAAIEALEALITVGGALNSDSWRSSIDHLLMEVATNACKGFQNHVGKPIVLRGCGIVLEDFQLVALHALLASLLSPASVRPPYLSQGLDLFLRGKQSAGPKIAEFCAQALLALEVLIHPRALSLVDTGNNFSSGGSKNNTTPWDNSKVNRAYTDVYGLQDYLDMDDGFGTDALDISEHQKAIAVDCSPNKVTPKESDESADVLDLIVHQETESIKNKIGGNNDQVMLDIPHCAESGETRPDTVPHQGDTLLSAVSHLSADVGPRAIAKPESVVTSMTFHGSEKRELEDDGESSDSFPDIVDGNPDTDSDFK